MQTYLAVRYEPKNAYKHYELGKCFLALGDSEAAMEELQYADKLLPGVDYILDRLAQACMSAGDLKEAERLYDTIPDFRRRAYILRNIGLLYHKQGRHADAATTLRRAIKKEYHNHHGHYLLGLSFEALANPLAARQAYREAIQIRHDRYGRRYPEAEGRLRFLEEQTAKRGTSWDGSAVEGDKDVAVLGVIESYNAQRGFGFIRSSVGQRVFFHVTSAPTGFIVQEGASVQFDVSSSPKGPRAIKLRAMEPGA